MIKSGLTPTAKLLGFTLAISLGIAPAGAVYQGKQLAATHSLIAKGIDAARNGSDSLCVQIAAKIKPADYTYIVEHDPDLTFRHDALMRLGGLVDPLQTYSSLSRLARKEPDDLIRSSALYAIYQSFKAGKLKGRKKEVEQLAIDRLPHQPEINWSIRILGYCHTIRSEKALRSVMSGNYDKNLKDLAAKELRGEHSRL